jgi:hypothetical protein
LAYGSRKLLAKLRMDEWKRVTRPVPTTAPTPPTEWMSASGVARMSMSA